MKVLQIFRKPYLSIFFAFILLFISCKQYDIKNDVYNFSLEIYNKFKDSNIKTNFFLFLKKENTLAKKMNY